MYPSMFTLNTGAQIPSIGLGTWQAQPKELEEVSTFTPRRRSIIYLSSLPRFSYSICAEITVGIDIRDR